MLSFLTGVRVVLQDTGRTGGRACFSEGTCRDKAEPNLSVEDWDLKAVLSVGGLGIAVCLHCPLHSGVFLFPTCRLCFYICCHSVTIFCTVGFKVSSATRASRLQLLM